MTAVSALETIAREFGSVTVRYVPENASDVPEDDMRWTVEMVESIRITVGGEEVDWWNHEHGATIEETAEALLALLRQGVGTP